MIDETRLREIEQRAAYVAERGKKPSRVSQEYLNLVRDSLDLIAALREARAENTRMSEALSLIAANLSENPREDAHAALSRDAGREG